MYRVPILNDRTQHNKQYRTNNKQRQTNERTNNTHKMLMYQHTTQSLQTTSNIQIKSHINNHLFLLSITLRIIPLTLLVRRHIPQVLKRTPHRVPANRHTRIRRCTRVQALLRVPPQPHKVIKLDIITCKPTSSNLVLVLLRELLHEERLFRTQHNHREVELSVKQVRPKLVPDVTGVEFAAQQLFRVQVRLRKLQFSAETFRKIRFLRFVWHDFTCNVSCFRSWKC